MTTRSAFLALGAAAATTAAGAPAFAADARTVKIGIVGKYVNMPDAYLSVAEAIREWLERAPEKVLFATDAYPFSEEMDWEEAGWVAATAGRQALGLALTEMMHDDEITRERALEIARMVLRDNARKLYLLYMLALWYNVFVKHEAH